MLDAPDNDVLLDAIAAWLGQDVVGAIADPALSFRVRIAAHLLGGLAREVRTEHADDRAHLAELVALGAEDAPAGASRDELRAAIRAAERGLAERIRAVGAGDDASTAALAAGLRRIAGRKARLGNPKFALDGDEKRP